MQMKGRRSEQRALIQTLEPFLFDQAILYAFRYTLNGSCRILLAKASTHPTVALPERLRQSNDKFPGTAFAENEVVTAQPGSQRSKPFVTPPVLRLDCLDLTAPGRNPDSGTPSPGALSPDPLNGYDPITGINFTSTHQWRALIPLQLDRIQGFGVWLAIF